MTCREDSQPLAKVGNLREWRKRPLQRLAKVANLRFALLRVKSKRTFMDCYGFLWVFIDSYGFLWVCIDSYGFLWVLVSFYEFLWVFMCS